MADRDDKFLMPNAVQAAELQHVCDNALKDIHEDLQHWEGYYQQLKHFESLLVFTERRQRYVWTCVRGTDWAWAEDLFDRFESHLYEKRWKAVAQFVSDLLPLLHVLVATFDADKYNTGVDGKGAKLGDSKEQMDAKEKNVAFKRLTHVHLLQRCKISFSWPTPS